MRITSYSICRTLTTRILIPVVAALLITAAGAHAQELQRERIAERFARLFPREHISRLAIDDTIAARAWTNYLAALDYERLYFLQADIDRFTQSKTNIDDALKTGNIQFALDVHSVLRERIRDRVHFVEQMLATAPDLSVAETYRWKREKAPWVASKEEWDELWRRKIKNEYVQVVVSRAMNAAATNKPADAANRDEDKLDSHLEPRAFVIKRYRQNLTMADDSDADWVFQRYLTAFAQAYDPHSDYMSPAEEDDFNIEMRLSLEGIGAVLRSEDGAAQVVSLVPGGPAAMDKSENRLAPGDKIVAVGQKDEPPESVLHWPLTRIVNRIRGPKGTLVVLVVIPASDPSGSTTKTVSLVRDEVKLEEQAATSSVHTVQSPEGTARLLGVIALPTFYANMQVTREDDPAFKSSTRDVLLLLEGLKSRRIDGLLLDLRNNGGGSLIEAIQMTGLFLPEGPIVQVAERNIRVLKDPDPTVFYDGPMVVLVNRLSASASEILAAALQDYGRAVIVGDSKTHGKGTVQTIVPIGNNEKYGSMRVTNAGYYRVTGRSTQFKGVTPDIVLPSALEYLGLGEDSLPNAMSFAPIPPASFTQISNMQPVIADLDRKSVARRLASERFQSYTNLLARIEEIQRSEEVPLELEARTQLAHVERDLRDIQRKLYSDSQTDALPQSTGKDLIRDEALQILNDLVTLTRGTASPVQTVAEQQPADWRERFRQWFRRF